MDSRGTYRVTRKEGKGGEVTISICGRLALENLKAAMEEIKLLWRDIPGSGVTVDLRGLDYLDSAGALLLEQLQQEAQARSIPVRLINLNDRVRGIMGLLDRAALKAPTLKPSDAEEGFFEYVGGAAARLGKDVYEVLAFVGELLTALGHAVLRPRSIRWGEGRLYMDRVGVD
ncbi:MAG: STAS domain-containing protein, partial [Thermodesulfobacteriota bacterium]